MSTRVSSATNLSATYFMRNFYSNNRDAIADTLNSLFGNDNDFTSSLYRVSRQMSSSSYDDYYTSLRAGSNINLTV